MQTEKANARNLCLGQGISIDLKSVHSTQSSDRPKKDKIKSVRQNPRTRDVQQAQTNRMTVLAKDHDFEFSMS